MIKINSLHKSWDGGKTFSVKNLDLDIKKGELLVLLGSSGCGKSTTLKMINRLIEPTSGTIEVDGVPNTEIDSVELKRKIGYVFQKIGLFPHMTIEENVCIVPKLLKWPREKMFDRAKELMDLVELPLSEYGDRLPDELSGGQQQRIGVARALAADPDYLLMDEPFGALDAVTRDSLQKEVIDLKTEIGKTIIFVTHDLFEALLLGDRIAVMDKGILQQCGSPEELINSPETDFVKELFLRPAKQLSQFKEVF